MSRPHFVSTLLVSFALRTALAAMVPVCAIAAAACSSTDPPPQSQPSSAASGASGASGSTDAQGSPILASPAEQVRMQQYIDSLYDRRYVRASFADGNAVIDCIDWDKQPACRNPGACTQVATPPPPPPSPPPIHPAPGAAPPASPPSPPPPTAAASLNGPGCPKGTVPIRRPSIEVLRRFRTLEDYFRK